MKTLIFIFMFIGSSAGSYVPVLWGADLFSMSSVFWGAVGGFVGIWAGWKMAQILGIE
ncbi:MAG: hypothetical protein P4L62_02430 [Candidatus Pacebacteria bacterium]|nr:hypothetical protein [Candidatus Paceibacterota bacterium]MDR3583190.1 hypothetical protein [Candidatus Paceibacterota bacterium]